MINGSAGSSWWRFRSTGVLLEGLAKVTVRWVAVWAGITAVATGTSAGGCEANRINQSMTLNATMYNTFNRKGCLKSSPGKEDFWVLSHTTLRCPSRSLLRWRGPWILSLGVSGHDWVYSSVNWQGQESKAGADREQSRTRECWQRRQIYGLIPVACISHDIVKFSSAPLAALSSHIFSSTLHFQVSLYSTVISFACPFSLNL